jgi:hypothetical protein
MFGNSLGFSRPATWSISTPSRKFSNTASRPLAARPSNPYHSLPYRM